MSEVKVFNNDVGRALRKLKKKLIAEGQYKEWTKRRYFEKPSTRRRRKKVESKKRFKKIMHQNNIQP